MDLKQVMAGDPGTGTQNLINQSRVSRFGSGPGFYKSIVLDILSVLSAGFFGLAYYRYLESEISILFLLGALTLFAVLSVLQVFLAKKTVRRLIVIVLEVVALLGLFYRDNVTILLVTAGVIFAFLAWGYAASRSQLSNSIELQFFRITGNVLGKLTTGALIFMILIYVPQFNENAVFVSRQSFRQFFDWSAGIINDFYPNVSVNGSFEDFAQSVAKMELQNNPNFQTLTPEAQSSTINQAAAQLTTTFTPSSTASSSGQLSANAPASDAFYNFIVGMLSAWASQGPTWFIIGWAVVLFLSLRTVGILFVWLAQFISLIFYEILLATGFMKISESTQTKENIGY